MSMWPPAATLNSNYSVHMEGGALAKHCEITAAFTVRHRDGCWERFTTKQQGLCSFREEVLIFDAVWVCI